MHKHLYSKAAGYLSDRMCVTMITSFEKRDDVITGVRKRLHLQSNAYVYPDLIILTDDDRITIYEPIRSWQEEMIRMIAGSDESIVIATILNSPRTEMIGKKFILDPSGDVHGVNGLPSFRAEDLPGSGGIMMKSIMTEEGTIMILLEG